MGDLVYGIDFRNKKRFTPEQTPIENQIGIIPIGRLRVTLVPSGWTGDQPIIGNPGCVPAFDSLPTHRTFKATDLASVSHRFSSAINRTAFAGPVKGFNHLAYMSLESNCLPVS
jgi:hypothetical protein